MAEARELLNEALVHLRAINALLQRLAASPLSQQHKRDKRGAGESPQE